MTQITPAVLNGQGITGKDIAGIIARIVQREGGYVDNARDRGGATKYGITRGTLAQFRHGKVVSAADVANLQLAEAEQIYKTFYVDPFAAVLYAVSLPFAEFMINSGVQHGVGRAIKWLQEAAGAVPDGELGPKSLSAVANDVEGTFRRMVALRAKFYGDIIARDESQRIFAAGWFRRLAADLS